MILPCECQTQRPEALEPRDRSCSILPHGQSSKFAHWSTPECASEDCMARLRGNQKQHMPVHGIREGSASSLIWNQWSFLRRFSWLDCQKLSYDVNFLSADFSLRGRTGSLRQLFLCTGALKGSWLDSWQSNKLRMEHVTRETASETCSWSQNHVIFKICADWCVGGHRGHRVD